MQDDLENKILERQESMAEGGESNLKIAQLQTQLTNDEKLQTTPIKHKCNDEGGDFTTLANQQVVVSKSASKMYLSPDKGLA
jgi:hypothetical protein